MKSYRSVPRALLVCAATGLIPAFFVTALRSSSQHAPASVAIHAANPTTIPASIAGVSQGWWSEALAHIEGREYLPTPSSEGLQAPNRAHGFRAYYRPGGIEIVPRAEAGEARWSFSWRTTGWGRPGGMAAIDAASSGPMADGDHVRYERPGFCEWYVNGKDGLEQGFTIHERPAGDGALRLEGAIGGLRPRMDEEGGVDFLGRRGDCVLRYGKLLVLDARGHEVDSRLAVEGQDLAIVVDDADATYPLTIDPLLTSASWTFEPDQAYAYLGVSVAAAGDVNGDGYSDVIVGASGFDNGESNEGAAFVFHGSPGGLAGSPSWSSYGGQGGVSWGVSVAGAGDVNGDGYFDVIIGAPLYDNGQVAGGRAGVYLGSDGGLGPVPDWTADGSQSLSWFGACVAAAGDVNADGYADVIVGAPQHDNGQADEGRAFVYLGSDTGLSPAPVWMAESNQTGALFGACVATAGDVNADGYADVIVGAYSYDNGQTDEGRAYLYVGSAGGVSPSPAWTDESDEADAEFGRCVATVGDINGDGYADIAVGSPYEDSSEVDAGAVHLYWGSEAGPQIYGRLFSDVDQEGARWGWSVGTAGDVNGDGYADVIVSALAHDNFQFDEGYVAVYEGGLDGLRFHPDWRTESNQNQCFMGYSVGTAGDVNGDGYSDVIIGAAAYNGGENDEGKAWVFHGLAEGLQATPDWISEGNQYGAGFGYSLASAGDVNGDGYSDVVVGAPWYGDQGRVFVYHGSMSGLSASPDWTETWSQQDGYFGASVASAGDVNYDGYDDIIVGAPSPHGGRVFVYHGSPSGLLSPVAWAVVEGDWESQFGISVAGAGDVNGDGYADVVVGEAKHTNAETWEGRALVYHGSAHGLPPDGAADWVFEPNMAVAHFGCSVSGAGDVDGDGFSDIVVGAYGYNDARGRAYLFRGSDDGLFTFPHWYVTSLQSGAWFGSSVATAGDVNGDGYSDIFVGAEHYTNGQLWEGRAYVFHGSAGGLPVDPNWVQESNQANAYFGHSIATAGDLNGDGYSDVVIGAHGYANGQPGEGRALVYHGSPGGLEATHAWAFESNQENVDLGKAVAMAGDVNGDGFSDLVVGADRYTNDQFGEGRAFLFYGNSGDGLDKIARQARADNDGLISVGGVSDSETGFRIRALGRTPAGRGRVRIEYEVARHDRPFDGIGLHHGPYFDTGEPASGGSAVNFGRLIGGLDPGTPYHWRLRIATDSPFFPHSRWLSIAHNAPSEADLRTAEEGATGVDEEAGTEAAGPLLGPGRPNPFRGETLLSYTVPREGRVRLSIHDVRGREVASLADGVIPAGSHMIRWDGRDARGAMVPAGAYFARLEFDGRTEARKIVRAP